MERTGAELRGDLVKGMVDRGMQQDLAAELRRHLENWLPHPLVDNSEIVAAEQTEARGRAERANEYEAARTRKEEEQRLKRANRMDLREIAGRSRPEQIRARVAEKYGTDQTWDKARERLFGQGGS